jgi:hypothetical protein
MHNQHTRRNTLNPQERSYLFTVRVWQDGIAGGKKEWRGQVRFVPSGDTRYFREWSTLMAFIESMLSEIVME